jgi:hypothetical protein
LWSQADYVVSCAQVFFPFGGKQCEQLLAKQKIKKSKLLILWQITTTGFQQTEILDSHLCPI